MKPLTLLESYVFWHYGRGYSDLYHIWSNFLWFFFHLFSVTLLARSLFSPWKRMGEEYPKGFNLGAFFSAIVVNTLMRIVGFFIRLALIAVGLILSLITFFAGLLVFVFWTLMPVLLIAFVIIGFYLIIHG